jgi:5-deoxy-glucuronate isomerase
MSELLLHPSPDGDAAAGRTIVDVTPASAGWGHVGFEAVALAPGASVERDTGERETCVVVVTGRVHVRSPHGEWRDLGVRADAFSGPPEAAYLPPGTRFVVEATERGAEVGLCHAPASTGAPARALRIADIDVQTRGYDTHERTVNNIMMDGQPAERLLVCEVVTPSGSWSSYPPHKHDRDALPEESLLEETYYHRVKPADGFGLQRVYTDDRSLDETVAVYDRDTVLVPRGYHTVAAPPGVSVYYLNVMAGPSRTWAFADDPALAWTRAPGATLGGRLGPEPPQPASHPDRDPR